MIKDITECALDLLSENKDKFELSSNKHIVFEENPYVGDVQNCFDVINEEIDEMGSKQLVMAKTCKNKLDVSHYLPMVDLSQDDEFTLIEVKENEIRNIYDKVFLQASIFQKWLFLFANCGI